MMRFDLDSWANSADIFFLFRRNKRNGLINIWNILHPSKCEVKILLLLFPGKYRFKVKEDYEKNVENNWKIEEFQ